jgi:hypothetical protein
VLANRVEQRIERRGVLGGGPTITASVPATAPLTLPLRGASMSFTPRPAARLARRWVVVGLTVLRSTMTSPAFAPSMRPRWDPLPTSAASTIASLAGS